MAEIVRLHPSRPCPICGKASAQAFHPFCSGRCQDIDLNRWLSGAYAAPVTAEPEDDATEAIGPGAGADSDDE